MKDLSKDQLHADVHFLFNRAMQAGSWSSDNNGRDTGMSSNSIVAIAYDQCLLNSQVLPSDQSDLTACQLMWEKLPAHRKTHNAVEAMRKATAGITDKTV